MNQNTNTGLTNQQAMPQTAQASATQGQSSAAPQMYNSQFNRIIQQVTELRKSLNEFIDQEDFPDAALMSASGVLEHHLEHYHKLAVQKENQKPGLETF